MRLRSEIPESLLQLLELQNLGPKKIALFWRELQITSITELEEAARKQRLRSLPGMGVKSEARILKAIEDFRRHEGRFRLDHGLSMAGKLVQYLEARTPVTRIQAAGSSRRRRETVGDIDILVSCESPEEAISAFVEHADVVETLAKGSKKASVVVRNGIQVDLRVVKDESFGAALQYFTGSKAHNVALRERAKRMGFKINEYGLFEIDSELKVAGEQEADIYGLLGLDFIPPELRENRGEIEKAEAGELPCLLEESDMRGDIHMHTTASDGRNSIEEMAGAVQGRGYVYMAITDHSKALAMTGGLDEKRVLDQIEEIERLRPRFPDLTLFTGIEVDILAEGQLDLDNEVLAELDVVIASVHSRFNLSKKDMTKRICRALENPHVNILSHPTGRLLLRREPYEVDLEEVSRAAVANRVCLEINAHPERLDLNDVQSRMARDRGALISLNADAHSTEMLDLISYGVATGRRGWLEPSDVINTFTVDQLKKVLNKEHYR
jgi:DNA polymerase (family 10)